MGRMFETFAALSTIGFITIFIILFQMDRAGRREEAQRDLPGADQQRER